MNISQKPVPGTVMTSTQQTPDGIEGSDEISLIDILKFLRRQFKVIGGITILAVLLGLVTSFATAPQVRRELLLTLKLPPEFSIDPEIAARESLMRNEILAAGNLALDQDLSEMVGDSTQSASVGGSLTPAVEENSERLQLILTSEDAAILEAAEQSALDTLQDAADQAVNFYIEPKIARLDLLIQRTREKVTRLEDQLAPVSTPTEASAITEASAMLLASALQLSQQSVLAEEISKLLDYELQRDGWSDLQAENEPLVSIDVLMTTQTEISSSLLKRLILSAIAGFMLSVVIALIVDQLPRLRAELAALDD